jgi:hypothetical protein
LNPVPQVKVETKSGCCRGRCRLKDSLIGSRQVHAERHRPPSNPIPTLASFYRSTSTSRSSSEGDADGAPSSPERCQYATNGRKGALAFGHGRDACKQAVAVGVVAGGVCGAVRKGGGSDGQGATFFFRAFAIVGTSAYDSRRARRQGQRESSAGHAPTERRRRRRRQPTGSASDGP